jgi:hypothetical protein
MVTATITACPRAVAMSFVVKGRSDTRKSMSNVRRYEWVVSRFMRWVREECVIQALPMKAQLMRYARITGHSFTRPDTVPTDASGSLSSSNR